MLRVALGARRPDPRLGRLLQQSLGRAADAGAHAGGAAFGVFEIGMNHAGEITPLVAMVRPHVALVTTIAPVHIEHLGSIEAIADAKAEIFSGVRAGRRGRPQSRRAAIRAARSARRRRAARAC